MLDQKQTSLLRRTQDDVLVALVGSVHMVRYFSVYLTVLSILLATFIPHEGFFPTSQSAGMTNYHRWLYDQYVIFSCAIGCLLYMQFKRKKGNLAFRRKLNAYIKSYAYYNVALGQKVQEQEGELSWQKRITKLLIINLLSNRLVKYTGFALVICGPIAMYIWMTPFESTYKSTFWILTWWPLNALIILGLYSMQLSILLHLFSSEEIYQYYRRLQRKAECKQELQ